MVTPFPPEDRGEAVFIVIERESRERAFIDLLAMFQDGKKGAGGIAKTAVVDSGSHIGEDVVIGEFTTVGAGCTIGAGTVIGSHTAIGDNCRIGAHCRIHPRVTLYARTEIWDDVCIHAGVVVGSDGFGYSRVDGEHRKIPQIGGVIIEDGVEIGANTTIDRATIGHTRIGRGTKIDNLVQIAHNVDIGENVIICGLCGISGSVTIGNNVILAGAVGLADHIVIEDDVFIGPKAGVMEKVVRKGSKLLGIPARDYKTQMTYFAIQPRMREMYDDVNEIKKRLGM